MPLSESDAFTHHADLSANNYRAYFDLCSREARPPSRTNAIAEVRRYEPEPATSFPFISNPAEILPLQATAFRQTFFVSIFRLGKIWFRAERSILPVVIPTPSGLEGSSSALHKKS